MYVIVFSNRKLDSGITTDSHFYNNRNVDRFLKFAKSLEFLIVLDIMTKKNLFVSINKSNCVKKQYDSINKFIRDYKKSGMNHTQDFILPYFSVQYICSQ